MKILVTGGTGFVGSHLIRELLNEKTNTVYALIRDRRKLENFDFKKDVTVIDGDLFSASALPADIELVFHLAALTKVVSPKEFVRANHDGTLSLLTKLRPLTRLRKVVLLSSLAALGPNPAHERSREDRTADPVSLYGKSKLAQEKIFREFCPAPYVIVRAPIVFGPGDMDMLPLFRIFKKGILPLLGNKERLYSIIYVKDLVSGMIAAADSSDGNDVFHITNSEPVSWANFSSEAFRLLEVKKIRRIFIPETALRVLAEFSEMRIRIFKKKSIFNRDKFREIRFPVWTASAEKSRDLLHFQSRFPAATAMEETIRWYRQQNLL